MFVGRVKEVWRYPLKSMAGERLSTASVGARGLWGDRGWALRDERAGEIRGAKISPALMLCAARYREEPAAEGAPPHADITLPDGTETSTDAADVNERLSELVGRKVTLWPLQPASDLAHYRRAIPAARVVGFLSRSRNFRRLALSATRLAGEDKELREEVGPEAAWDVRRFRPNFLIETADGIEGLVESDCGGRRLRVGGLTLKCEMPAPRCSM